MSQDANYHSMKTNLRKDPDASATVLWKYRAIYLDGDPVFGQWSDVVSLAVAG